MLKRRYNKVNKTKEEMIKFLMRRCFEFIKDLLAFEEDPNDSAEEKEKKFYYKYFGQDEELKESLIKNDLTIDDMIPFKQESKIKTMNQSYLNMLF